jgi:hypothetical protein
VEGAVCQGLELGNNQDNRTELPHRHLFKFAGSAVIQYDTGLLSPGFLHEVMAEKNVEWLKEVLMTLLPERGF